MVNKKVKNIITMSVCAFLALSVILFPIKHLDEELSICVPDDKIGGEIM